MPADSTYLNDIRRTFRNYRTMAERAIAQVGDDRLQATLDAEDNNIAIIMQHVTGNLQSRFTGFLTSDGEKPDRNRDAEFETHSTDRAALMSAWNNAWEIVERALDALTPEDLERTVHIRQQPMTVVEALNRSVTHTAYHVGQIVFLAKHHAGAGWQTLSLPKKR
jgi:uncharacterized damage-inducible protein DinB